MNGCSSTDTTRRPSASAYSTWSRCAASASSLDSFHGSSSCTYRLRRLIRRQTSSSAAVSSTSSIRSRTASTRPVELRRQLGGRLGGRHDAVAVAVDHRERAAGEVAVLVGELGVVPRLEPLGRDLAVGAEAHLAQHVEAQRVRPVDVGHVEGLDHVAERLRHLVLAEQQVAVDGHLLRHLDLGRHQQRRPDDGVELEDVLPDQVDRRRPELLGEVLALAGVGQRRVVVEERVDPDVDHLRLVPRHRHPPLEARAGQRDVAQSALDERERLVVAVLRRDEAGAVGVELLERLLEGRQPEEPVVLLLSISSSIL